jgi:hypothetical protein
MAAAVPRTRASDRAMSPVLRDCGRPKCGSRSRAGMALDPEPRRPGRTCCSHGMETPTDRRQVRW